MDTERMAIQVLLGVGVVIALTYTVKPLCRWLRQPVVVGQILVGLAVGALPASVKGLVFPTNALPFLTVLSQVGLVLFLFVVGYELDLRFLQRRRKSALMISVGGLVVPMVLGTFLAYSLIGTSFGRAADKAGHGPFVLFMAVAMSITAVPVLAWIIRERAIMATVPGVVAMASAGIMDVLGWLLLTVAVASVSSGGHSLTTMLLLLPAYLLAMVFVVRPALRWWMRSPRTASVNRVPTVIVLVLASAWCTGKLGLHVVVGALLLGFLMPRQPNGAPDRDLLHGVERAGSALLPVFFVVTGLSVDLRGLHAADWALLAGICLLATAGKLGGGALAARLSGLGMRDSLLVGVLLNTRGLTELIALNVGFQAGLLDKKLYTILVLMAVVTTALTGPLLSAFGISAAREAEPGDAPPADTPPLAHADAS